MSKIMLSEPTSGYVDHQAYDNRKDFIAQSSKWAMKSGHELLTGNCGRYVIQNVREDMADNAIRMGCDYLCFIDDDMIVPFDTLEKLFSRMDRCDMVTPLAFQRVPPFLPVMYSLKMIEASLEEKKQKSAPLNQPLFKVDFRKIEKWPENDLFEVDAVGFGCVLFKTEILKKLPRPWFSSWMQIGEDIWFSWNAHRLGFKVCVDTSFCIGHLADRPIISRAQYEEFRNLRFIKCWNVSGTDMPSSIDGQT